MNEAFKVSCLQPSSPPVLKLMSATVPSLQKGKVLIRVSASSVNPIDVKRAAGYGARLLGLKGAGRFPLVLGNDFTGAVEAVGEGVEGWRVGDRVLGLLATGSGDGAHRSHLLADPSLLIQATARMTEPEQAVLPYSFTTVWHAIASAGLAAGNARGSRVLVHGASGGLGTLALQILSHWGANITAICGPTGVDQCRVSGATEVFDYKRLDLGTLSANFDAVLNFASWQDESELLARLRHGALGYATTVHPLLSNIDRLGFMRGGLRCWAEFRSGQRQARARRARYGWTMFKPSPSAMIAMAELIEKGIVRLPLEIVPMAENASEAFNHVLSRKAGRAALRFTKMD
jgi:NADPH:quinone reductase-like Zn-dependent oxidoreductase